MSLLERRVYALFERHRSFLSRSLPKYPIGEGREFNDIGYNGRSSYRKPLPSRDIFMHGRRWRSFEEGLGPPHNESPKGHGQRKGISNMTPAYLEGGLESPRTTSDNFGEGPDPPGMSFEPIRGGLKPFPCRPSPYRNPLLLVADLSKAHEKGFFLAPLPQEFVYVSKHYG